MKIVKISCTHKDQRGSITDIVEQIDFNGATIIESKAGAIRGNHYHKKTVQYVYVLSGEMKCTAKKAKGPIVEAKVKSGDLVSHEFFEAHAFEALTDTSFLVLSSGLRTGQDYEKDTYRLNVPLLKYSEDELA